MSITTKKGDTGKTSLWSGQKIQKDNIRIDAYGTLDELEAFLSEAKHFLQIQINKEIIIQIQTTLKKIMGELATTNKKFVNPITQSEIENIEAIIYNLEKNNKITSLVELGKTIPAAKLDICRTITRRAERIIVKLNKKEKISKHILIYINRLSDLLFLLARNEE